MPPKSAALVQGTLDMLILKTLALEPLHGYGIALRIEQMSQGVFRVNPGSLFPAFRRLERAGLLSSDWSTEGGRGRRVYPVTRRGRGELAGRRAQWRTFVSTIEGVLAV